MAARAAEKKQEERVVTKTTIPDFDRVIHEKTRLAMISALAVNPTLTFNELKAILKTTDGNVSVHARKLEEASYISCKKSFAGRVPLPQDNAALGIAYNAGKSVTYDVLTNWRLRLRRKNVNGK